MENEVLLERIRKWQEEPVFHELTCGNDDCPSCQGEEDEGFNEEKYNQSLLKGEVRDGTVVLVCPSCDYVQNWLPELFEHPDFDKHYTEAKRKQDELVQSIREKRETNLMKELREKGFFDQLEEKLTVASCDSQTLRLSRELLAKLNYSEEQIEQICQFFESRGGYCDCEIFLNVV